MREPEEFFTYLILFRLGFSHMQMRITGAIRVREEFYNPRPHVGCSFGAVPALIIGICECVASMRVNSYVNGFVESLQRVFEDANLAYRNAAI